MKKIYIRVLFLAIMAGTWSASYANPFFSWNDGIGLNSVQVNASLPVAGLPGLPGFTVNTRWGLNLNPGIRYISGARLNVSSVRLVFFRKLHLNDSLRIRTSGLKPNVVYKPYLMIFSATTINITKKLSLITPPSSASYDDFNQIDPQYRNIFGNFSVTSPVHDQLTLSYSLERDNRVTAKIFNVLGSEVATLFSDEYQAAGQRTKVYNIADRGVSSGIYILRLTAGSARVAKRIQVL